MSSIAIVGNLNIDQKYDPGFRYKMSTILVQTEGKGNKSKTCIKNCTEIAKQLKRTPGQICKFFGCQLGTRTCITSDGDAIISGHHETNVLQQLLDIFIDKFVLCPKCLLPETELLIKKDNIFHNCNACGFLGMVDMTHKLCTFILQVHNAEKKLKKSKKDAKLLEKTT